MSNVELKSIDINVSQEDIDKANKLLFNIDHCVTQFCPVYQSLKRRYPEKDIHVYEYSVEIDGVEYNFPKDVIDKLLKYDKLKGMEPFNRTIEY